MTSKKNVVESKKAKSKKLKEVSSKVPKKPEKQKKNLRVPPRHPREPFKTLMLSRRPPTVSSEKAYAYEIRKLGGVYKDFLKMDSLGEVMDTPAHKVGMPIRFSSTLYAPPLRDVNSEIIHFIYKTFNFSDDLTKYDIFRRAAHYSPMLGKRKRATDAFRLAGMAVCANFDVRRRQERLKIRGKWRPEYSNYGRRMMEAPRSLAAKLLKYSQPYFGQLITQKKEDARAMTEACVRQIAESFQAKDKETRKRFTKFRRHNHAWVEDRKKCHKSPMFLKISREKLSRTIVNRHWDMPWRRRGDQDLFNEFNYLSSHFAFSAHFCRVVRGFKVNLAKEDEAIHKNTSLTPLIRVRVSRSIGSRFRDLLNQTSGLCGVDHPCLLGSGSVLLVLLGCAPNPYQIERPGVRLPILAGSSYLTTQSPDGLEQLDNEKDELQTILPRIPKRAPSIAAVSGYSSDSQKSTATNTPLDCLLDWEKIGKVKEHRLNVMGDITRSTTRKNADKEIAERKWREMGRRKKLMYKEDGRFELQNTVPILKEITKMHPPFIYCKLKGMELNKLRKSKFPENMTNDVRYATAYLFKQRINFLEKTLPCKDDPRILLTPGWKIFATRENPDTFPNVARILKQRSSWVSKHSMSRAATVPRCDKLPMAIEGKNKKLFLILILPLTIGLMTVTFGMISFL
ncbi:hypothetical protein CAEBREN_17910 [Caenorhabditis brenneri]|uniref:Uncharacterized protein n=1 Tax=Caenorhabditis brenneri TaxID=135651 RepID=G0P541_CAEBE|nr:hypothetical protein CAEBREN_17910 [Caenorhabditis brenneri]